MTLSKRTTSLILTPALCLSLCMASAAAETESVPAVSSDGKGGSAAVVSSDVKDDSASPAEVSTSSRTEEMSAVEDALNLSNMNSEWTYDDSSDSWTLSVVTAVTNPEIEDEQGVSVCVPGAYVKGIDTDGDGVEDVTSGAAAGNLVIDYDASVTSTNGQTYTASTAPVIVNTGAAGYSEQSNQTASSTYAAEGYINVACGNRGKQSTLSDGTYTGDAPSCLVDQKNAVRFVKYNILLGNIPGSVEYFVSTGGSGGGAHAAMLAATSDNPDFYDYEIAAGAVGVYKDPDGNYVTSVMINGEETELSDGMWGCMAYSAITSLAEADMAMAFEYFLDTTYSFNTDFQKKMAGYLAAEYMDYINSRNLSVNESDVGFDLNGDDDTDDEVALTIEYDADTHADTNGYYGTYVDLYLAEFEDSLNDYLARLDYADDWTWFDSEGNALSDEEVAAMTSEDRARAFIEGRYAKGSTGSDSMGGPGGMGGFGGGMKGNGGPEGMGGNGRPEGLGNGGPDDMNFDQTEGGGIPDGMSSGQTEGGGIPDGMSSGQTEGGGIPDGMNVEEVGTPDAGTTQSAGSSTNSANYSSFEEMLEAYKEDIAQIEEGDMYGNNIVELYDPTNYIGAEDTNGPTWARLLMGASEGDISMFNSLNLQIAWLAAGTDAEIEWQWNGGHVPSEIFGDSLPLYVDMMYGKYVDGAAEITKEAPAGQTENGTETEATGTDLSEWITYDPVNGVSFSVADAAAYRTAGASKAIPGFDVIDYGQEDYVFGSTAEDARHWDSHVLSVLEKYSDELAELFSE